ncbi:MAG: hypothetical protein ABEJ98_02450, partial [Candidatus Nanohaloarchaea archaeon]
REKQKHRERVYELAMVDIPEEKPVRVPFQHASFIAQTVPEEDWETKGIESLKRTGHVPDDIDETGVKQVMDRLEKAKNWARNHAPEEYRYGINFDVPEETIEDLNEEQREAMQLLAEMLGSEEFDDQEELDGEIFDVRDESELETGEFFTTAYRVLLAREQGPRLSRLIMSIGQEDAAEILEQVG